MAMDDRDGVIWIDGDLVPWREAKIHVLTHGLHYASAVFEGIRAYDGSVFKLRQHTERLLISASLLDLPIDLTADDLDDAVGATLSANALSDAYIRPVIWRGSESISAAAPNNTIHIAIAAWDWPSYFDPEKRMQGLRLTTARLRRPPPECLPPEAKASANYAITTVSKHAALADGFDDTLLLDWRGYVAEASAANIFFVRDGEIHTPTPDCFLNGITRQTICEIAKNRGIAVVERHIEPDELDQFQECFLTGTASEVTPVAGIDGYLFPDRSVSRLMIDAYCDSVHS